MSKKPRLCLDVDEVLADFVRGYLDAVYECTGKRHSHADVTSWSIAEALSLTMGDRDRVEQAIRRPGFCANLKVLPGAVEAVAKLRERYDVVFVTSPLESWFEHTALFWCSERVSWLKRHFEASSRDVIFTHRKDLIAGEVLVDDHVGHIQDFPGRGVVWARPYNQHATGVRVSSWEELYALLLA